MKEWNKGKGGSIGCTLRPRKKAGRISAWESESVVTLRGRFRQEDFLSRGSIFLDPGLPTVLGAMGGFGGRGMSGRIWMALLGCFFYGVIDVLTVFWSCGLGPGGIGLVFKLPSPPFFRV